MKKKTKPPEFELWNVEQEYGLCFDSEIDCIDVAMELGSSSDPTIPSKYFIITKNKILIRSLIIEDGAMRFTMHD